MVHLDDVFNKAVKDKQVSLLKHSAYVIICLAGIAGILLYTGIIT